MAQISDFVTRKQQRSIFKRIDEVFVVLESMYAPRVKQVC